ncbi:hypothetical protein FQZ97_877290 [compost metagenome]
MNKIYPELQYDVVRRSDDSSGFDDHFDELCAFFQDAYGKGYNGNDSLSKKLEESDTIAQLHLGDSLAAVALSGLGRITSIGSASHLNRLARENVDVASRFDTMVQLLRGTKTTEGIDWISIGIEYDRMSSAAALAGLRRINCQGRIVSLLSTIDEANRYDIVSVEDGSVIVKKGYVQKIYAKEECECHDRDETDRHMFE